MSYDLVFAASAEQSGSHDGEALGEFPAEVWRQIVDRATQLLGPVHTRLATSGGELDHAPTGINLVLSASSGTITVPYGAQSDGSAEVLRQVYRLGTIVEEETGLVGYDPQVGQPLRSAADDASLGQASFDLVADMLARADATQRRAAGRRTGRHGTPFRLAEELAAVGVEITDVWELVRTNAPYPTAIPVLVRWLSEVEEEIQHERNRAHVTDGLVRALTVVEARGVAAPALLRRLSTAENDGIRWAIGNACTVVATEADVDAVISVVRDSGIFPAYLTGFVETLGRIGGARSDETRALLLRGLEDEHLQGTSISALHRLGMYDAAEIVRQRFLNDERTSVRAVARSYVQECDARQGPGNENA